MWKGAWLSAILLITNIPNQNPNTCLRYVPAELVAKNNFMQLLRHVRLNLGIEVKMYVIVLTYLSRI